MEKRFSPYQDKNGILICQGDFVRQYVKVDWPEEEFYIYDRVEFVNGDWFLFDVNYDYEKGGDEPHLLSENYAELEVIDEADVEFRN